MKKFITQKQNNKFFLEKIIISLASFLLFFLNCNTSFAILDNKKLSLFKEDLLKVENYLNNIKNLSADFTQEVDKNRAEGKFYLSRNEKSSAK